MYARHGSVRLFIKLKHKLSVPIRRKPLLTLSRYLLRTHN